MAGSFVENINLLASKLPIIEESNEIFDEDVIPILEEIVTLYNDIKVGGTNYIQSVGQNIQGSNTIDTVGTDLQLGVDSKINTTGSNIAKVTTVADNITNVNKVADVDFTLTQAYVDIISTKAEEVQANATQIDELAYSLTQIPITMSAVIDGDLIMYYNDPITSLSLVDGDMIVNYN